MSREQIRLNVLKIKLAAWLLAAMMMTLGVWCGLVKGWFGVFWIIAFTAGTAVTGERLWRRWARCAAEL